MTGILHHIPDNLLLSYASGALSQPFSLVVATHVSMCDECRARLGAHESAGGAVLEASESSVLSKNTKDDLFARLDDAVDTAPVYERSGIFPGPLMQALNGLPPKWKSLGLGARQCILDQNSEGSVRLLYIPPGQAVPDHGHNGLEMTMVLQGAFRDETGRYGAGDVEIADADLEHTPTAEDGEPCICLAATDGALRFNSWMPRMLQPLFRI